MRAYACSVLAVLFAIAACVDAKPQKTASNEQALAFAGDGSGMTPPTDAGTTPTPDAGTMPPPDAGTPPDADAGTPPDADAGTPPPDADAGTPPYPGVCETCSCGVALGDFEFFAEGTYPYKVYVDVWKRKKNDGAWVYMTPSHIGVYGPTSGKGRPGIGLKAGLNYVTFATGASIRDTADLPLQLGTYTITKTWSDIWGNSYTDELTVTYSANP